MPSVTAKQVEYKWKNLKRQFSRYQRNEHLNESGRYNEYLVKMKKPPEYDIMCSLIVETDESEEQKQLLIDVMEFIDSPKDQTIEDNIDIFDTIKTDTSNDNKRLELGNVKNNNKCCDCEKSKEICNSLEKLNELLERSNKNIEKKLNSICLGQKEIIAALNKKNEILTKFLENDSK